MQQVTTNVSALTSLFAATLGSPIVKVAAFSYGVRRALADRRRDEVARRVKDTIKAERKAGRRRRGATAAATESSAADKGNVA